MGKKKEATSTDAAAPSTSTGIVQLSATMHMAIPPVWTMDPMASVLEQLDTLVMRFIPQLEGVLIAHSHAQILRNLGLIDGDSAYAEVPVRFTCLVWRPQIGMTLQGSITLSSPSHVSLLLYDTFNAAISAPHIPSSEWKFVYYSDVGEDKRESAKDRSVGFWLHKSTGERLGGPKHTLTFSVISKTIANHMLSLHGSLLSEPFSVPPPQPGTMSFDQTMGATEPMEEEEKARSEEAPMPRRVRWEDSEDETEQVVVAEGTDAEEGAYDYEATHPDEDQEDAHEEPDESLVEQPAETEDAQPKDKKDKKEKKEKEKEKKEKKEKKKEKKEKEKESKGEKKSKKHRHSDEGENKPKKRSRPDA